MTKYLLLLICFFSSYSFAQETEIEKDFCFQSINSYTNRPNLIFKWSLLSQLDFNSPSLQLGLEIKVSNLIGIHQEIGYVNNWLNPIYTLIDHDFSKNKKIKNGFKYIFEPRFYIFKKDKIYSSRMFFAPSFDFKFVEIQRKEWMLINRSFQQNIKYTVQRIEYGGLIKFGITTNIKKKMPLEIVAGLGFKYISLKNNLPKNAEFTNNLSKSIFNRPSIEKEVFLPSAYIGMLLQLPFKKK